MEYNKYHHSSGGFVSINEALNHQLGMNPNKSFLRVPSNENKSTLPTVHIRAGVMLGSSVKRYKDSHKYFIPRFLLGSQQTKQANCLKCLAFLFVHFTFIASGCVEWVLCSTNGHKRNKNITMWFHFSAFDNTIQRERRARSHHEHKAGLPRIVYHQSE